jgi:hypothetical protein
MARQVYGRSSSTGRWILIVVLLGLVGTVLFLIFSGGSDQQVAEPNNLANNDGQPEDVNDKPAPPEIEFKEFVPKSSGGVELPEEQAVPEIPAATAETPDNVTAEAEKLINQAAQSLEGSRPDIIKARDLLNEALFLPVSEDTRETVKKKMSELVDEWLFSKTVYEGDSLCDDYIVRPGDTLTQIGKDHKVPAEIIKEINGIGSARGLRAGETIKVIHGPFHCRISRSDFTLDLYLQKTFVDSFTIGIGKPGYETPTGLWVVEPGGKLVKPTWTDPDTGRTYEADDPDYPLGSRWIGLAGVKGNAKNRQGFAIHGTKDPNEIGAAVSRGCIRMHNGAAVLMYKLLQPGHSQVRVIE